MLIKTVVNNLFMANTYLLFDEDKRGIIIDPGSSYTKIIGLISKLKLSPTAIIATHGHIDHVIGVEYIKRRYNTPFYIHKMDEPLLSTDHYPTILNYINFPKINIPKPDDYLDEGSSQIEDLKMKIIHTPGHTSGSICIMAGNTLFTGDTIFKLSIGRTDLGGNLEELITSIHKKIFNLPNNIEILPGHGEKTTIGYEVLNNPYVGVNGIYPYQK